MVCSQRVRPTRRISRPFAMRAPPFQRHQDANGKAFYEKAWHKTIATSTVLKQEGYDNGDVRMKRGLLKKCLEYLLKQ